MLILERHVAVLLACGLSVAGCHYADEPSPLVASGPFGTLGRTPSAPRVAGDAGLDARVVVPVGHWGTAAPASLGEPLARRHVIIVIGDGMQLAHEIAASRYMTGQDDGLSFHAFPERTFQTTWDIDVYNAHALGRGVPIYSPLSFDPTVGYDPDVGGTAPYPLSPDSIEGIQYFLGPAGYSSSTATAMATGQKTQADNIAWAPGDLEGGELETSPQILRRVYGMSVGFVTTGYLPGATPAGWFAHNRIRWDFLGISHEMLAVSRPEVVLAGSGGPTGVSYVSPEDVEAMRASEDYVTVERAAGVDGSMAVMAAAVSARQQQKKLFGLFGAGDPSFAPPIPIDSPGQPAFFRSTTEDPSLEAASVAALEVLSQNPAGFFLMVEQADIDRANHANDFAWMIGCVHDLDDAVAAMVAFVDRPGDEVEWSNTTLIVTADHANSLLRLVRRLEMGDLPTQVGSVYPDGDVTYGSGNHTNELVTVYVRGLAADQVASYETVYPGLGIIDNTSIFHLTMDAAEAR